MIVAEEIRNAVLRFAKERGKRSFQAADVAKEISPVNWQDLLEQVKLVVDSLVKEGKVDAHTQPGKRQSFSSNEGHFSSPAKTRK